MAGKVTIKDVAREAGVSISTVSNALNGVDVLAPETREHVLEVAARLHYMPNLNGRNLKSSETKVIGLFVTFMRGPYFGLLADAIFEACRQQGYELNVFVTLDEKSAMQNILGKRVDGAIILNNSFSKAEIEQLREYEIPTVFLDRELCAPKMASVVFDSYQDGYTAGSYLLSKGAKRLCFVQGVLGNYDAGKRKEGFLKALQEAKIELEEDYLLDGGFDQDTAWNAMNGFLQKGLPIPDAVFAANDQSAIGTAQALLQAGIRIPQEVKIMGVDGIEQGEWFRPTITTIHTGFERQGRVTVAKLLGMIQGQENGETIRLKGTLIERESTKKDC